MNKFVFLLGSNMGDKLHQLHRACQFMSDQIGTIASHSSIYETQAWGVEDQPSFFNQVIVIYSDLPSLHVLEIIAGVEKELGRVRKKKWASRTIDIDILYAGNEIVNTKALTIPHPEMHQRRFTLIPLVEVDPDFIHPVLKLSNRELLKLCSDHLEVSKL